MLDMHVRGYISALLEYLKHGALCGITSIFTVLILNLSRILVHAGHLASYTFADANARCCPSCVCLSCFSTILEMPSQPHFPWYSIGYE